MITIPESHYRKLNEAVDLLYKNMSVCNPNNYQLKEVYEQWKLINQQLENICSKLTNDLQDILQKYRHFETENKELNEKITAIKRDYAEAAKVNTIQHSELAKNLAQYNKLKDLNKDMKARYKQKDQIIKQKDQTIEELSEKARKYKKMYGEQVKRIEKMEQIISVLEVTQKSSAKQKQLDDEMLQLQAELRNLQAEAAEVDQQQ